MRKMRNQYSNAKKNSNMLARMHDRYRNYGRNNLQDLSFQLNEERNIAIQSMLNHDMEQLETQMIKEMQEEVYQQVMNNIEKGFKVDTSLLSKSLADGINSALKSISK